MASDDLREAAKAVVRRQVWESERGKATRSFLREHPEVAEEFEKTGTITIIGLVSCTLCKGEGLSTYDCVCHGGGGATPQCSPCKVCNGLGLVELKEYPEHVTRASVLLELNTRARRKEASATARRWAEEHPGEIERLREEIRQEEAKRGEHFR